MYNRHADVEINMMGEGGKPKTFTVRQPTDAEWVKRYRSRHTLVKSQGRGVTDSKVIGREEADLALLKLLLVPLAEGKEQVEIDSAEACHVIETLAQADVVDGTKSADAMVFTLSVPGGITTHTVKIPSFVALKKCADASVRTSNAPYGSYKILTNIVPSQELYDVLVEIVDGYAGDPAHPQVEANPKTDVPIIHKYAIIDALHKEVTDLKTSLSVGDESVFV